MKLLLLVHTIVHLKIKQCVYQVVNRLCKRRFVLIPFVKYIDDCALVRFCHKLPCWIDDEFVFLNISSKFSSWNDTSHGMLWVYNLNYMDWLLQEGINFKDGVYWIDKFIDELTLNRVGLDPYPIALRGINWIKFMTMYQEELTDDRRERWNNYLYSQYVLLTRKLEYHLLGNHLLEDAYSLFIASIYFSRKDWYKKASNLLVRELKEQVLNDGCHYEQSPMYHCILLDRLLDCYNFSIHNERFQEQESLNKFMLQVAERMLGFLSEICYADGTYPMFNDSAEKIAPTPQEIFDYAQRLELKSRVCKLSDSGYRRMKSSTMEVFVDIGNIMASYQPGHSHADTFNYELRIYGIPFIVDTGISTYNKTTRRFYERSTVAHNTVSIGRKNSSEVWSGFRVGKQAKVSVKVDEDKQIFATHNGYGKCNRVSRLFDMLQESFVITDRVGSKNAVSYIHFAPNIDNIVIEEDLIKTPLGDVRVKNFSKIELFKDCSSTEYHNLREIYVVAIHFSNECSYEIMANPKV